MSDKLFIGVDVSKEHLDIYLSNNKSRKIKNTGSSISKYFSKLKIESIELLVVEATGGYQDVLVAFLHSKQIPVSVVNPKQTKSFLKSLGQNAKNDFLDSKMLCLYGERMNPRLTEPLPESVIELRSLVLRRKQLTRVPQKTAHFL